MKLKIYQKPRKFLVGIKKNIKLSDIGKIYLKSNEQITFVTDNFSKHDVTRKKWGFYATQSVNSRLNKKFKTAIVCNKKKKIFVMLVEKIFLKNFEKYCKEENQKVIFWLDEL